MEKLDVSASLVRSPSKTLYHVTLKASLPSILQYGLIPMIGQRSADCGETDEAVFCFPTKEDCDTAMSQWLGEAFDDALVGDDECVYLAIELSNQRSKSDVEYEIAILDTISPESIKMVFNENWSPYEPFVNGVIIIDEKDDHPGCAC